MHKELVKYDCYIKNTKLLGETVRECRKNASLTVEYVAKEIGHGYTTSSIRQIEGGKPLSLNRVDVTSIFKLLCNNDEYYIYCVVENCAKEVENHKLTSEDWIQHLSDRFSFGISLYGNEEYGD